MKMLANSEKKKGNKCVIKSCEYYDIVGDKDATFHK